MKARERERETDIWVLEGVSSEYSAKCADASVALIGLVLR